MQVQELHRLLDSWPLIPLESALQLLDYAYPGTDTHQYCLLVEETALG